MAYIYILGSSTMTISYWRSQQFGSFSAHETGCLSRTNMMLKAWKTWGSSWPMSEGCRSFSNIGKEMLQWQVKGTCQWNWGQASRKAKHLSPMSFPLGFHVVCHQKMCSTCRMDLPTSHDPLERIPLGNALQFAFSADSRATRLVNRDYHRSQASHEVEASDYQSAHQGPGLRRKSNYHLTEIGTSPKGVQTGHPFHFSQFTDVCANKMVTCLQHWTTPESHHLVDTRLTDITSASLGTGGACCSTDFNY